MTTPNTYAVVYTPDEFKEETLAQFETKEDMHAFLLTLHEKRNLTNQRLTEFAYVFPQGAFYPTDYEAFWKEARNKERKSYHVGHGYFIQRTLKKGKIEAEFYNFAEGFDWQLPEWKEEGSHDILILDMDEALSADYYIDRELLHQWGKKEEPLFA